VWWQNLDVNLAVNNLLSHEDDVPPADDQDGEESLPVIPSGGMYVHLSQPNVSMLS